MPRSRSAADAATRARAIECVRRLVYVLGQSARVVERRTGSTNAQLFLLMQLAREGGLTINQLAARASTQQSTVSLLVARLERAGLVVRERSAQDGRRVQVKLTMKGRRLARRAPQPPLERMTTGIDALTPAELAAISRGLGALLRELDAPAGAPLMFEA